MKFTRCWPTTPTATSSLSSGFSTLSRQPLSDLMDHSHPSVYRNFFHWPTHLGRLSAHLPTDQSLAMKFDKAIPLKISPRIYPSSWRLTRRMITWWCFVICTPISRNSPLPSRCRHSVPTQSTRTKKLWRCGSKVSGRSWFRWAFWDVGSIIPVFVTFFTLELRTLWSISTNKNLAWVEMENQRWRLLMYLLINDNPQILALVMASKSWSVGLAMSTSVSGLSKANISTALLLPALCFQHVPSVLIAPNNCIKTRQLNHNASLPHAHSSSTIPFQPTPLPPIFTKVTSIPKQPSLEDALPLMMDGFPDSEPMYSDPIFTQTWVLYNHHPDRFLLWVFIVWLLSTPHLRLFLFLRPVNGLWMNMTIFLTSVCICPTTPSLVSQPPKIITLGHRHGPPQASWPESIPRLFNKARTSFNKRL